MRTTSYWALPPHPPHAPTPTFPIPPFPSPTQAPTPPTPPPPYTPGDPTHTQPTDRGLSAPRQRSAAPCACAAAPAPFAGNRPGAPQRLPHPADRVAAARFPQGLHPGMQGLMPGRGHRRGVQRRVQEQTQIEGSRLSCSRLCTWLRHEQAGPAGSRTHAARDPIWGRAAPTRQRPERIPTWCTHFQVRHSQHPARSNPAPSLANPPGWAPP